VERGVECIEAGVVFNDRDAELVKTGVVFNDFDAELVEVGVLFNDRGPGISISSGSPSSDIIVETNEASLKFSFSSFSFST
jgi:hypothetical protein